MAKRKQREASIVEIIAEVVRQRVGQDTDGWGRVYNGRQMLCLIKDVEDGVFPQRENSSEPPQRWEECILMLIVTGTTVTMQYEKHTSYGEYEITTPRFDLFERDSLDKVQNMFAKYGLIIDLVSPT